MLDHFFFSTEEELVEQQKLTASKILYPSAKSVKNSERKLQRRHHSIYETNEMLRHQDNPSWVRVIEGTDWSDASGFANAIQNLLQKWKTGG